METGKCYFNVKWFIYAYYCMIFDLDANPYRASSSSGSTNIFDTDPTWLGTDPDISDSELDQLPSPVLLETDHSDSGSDSDPESGSFKSHPIMSSLAEPAHLFPMPQRELDLNPDGDEEEYISPNIVDLPETVLKLRKMLLCGYKCPDHPTGDLVGCELTLVEQLSLKHYIAWVDSHGTVKAYTLHREVLQEATGTKVLSLYMARKLAMDVTGLSSQLVDTCPRSCMAYTGEFKNDCFCVYVHNKQRCNEPHYNMKGKPRAQMVYTPITPIIQSLYKNKTMAEAMRYWHNLLQKALQNLDANLAPTEHSECSWRYAWICKT